MILDFNQFTVNLPKTSQCFICPNDCAERVYSVYSAWDV